MDYTEQQLIISGCQLLELDCSERQLEQLLCYKDLLIKWNKVYSLSAITNPRQILTHHLLDGLSVVNYFSQAISILDVGSGMGVPGIILAIMLPEIAVTVLDSNSKKCAFLRQVKIELALHNLKVTNQRVELIDSSSEYEVITSRAFADLALFTELTKHLLAKNGCYLALKSELGLQEIGNLAAWNCEVIKIKVPYLDAQRFLIKILNK